MKYAVWIGVALLLVLHQDYWQWNKMSLDFGFMPRVLTYHAALSIVAAILWFMATKFCWPGNLNDAESAKSSQSDEATS